MAGGVLSIISLKEEVDRIKQLAVRGKLRRMARASVNGIFPDEEFNRQKR